MTIIFMPCLKFLINLVIVCVTIDISFFILVFAFNIFRGFLYWFMFGMDDHFLDDIDKK